MKPLYHTVNVILYSKYYIIQCEYCIIQYMQWGTNLRTLAGANVSASAVQRNPEVIFFFENVSASAVQRDPKVRFCFLDTSVRQRYKEIWRFESLREKKYSCAV